jgi:hypothetical protein
MSVAETIFSKWIELYFARQGLEIHFESGPMLLSKSSLKEKRLSKPYKRHSVLTSPKLPHNGSPIKYSGYNLPLFRKRPEEQIMHPRFAVIDDPIVALLPKPPARYAYTEELLTFVTPRIWAHRYLCWIEWNQLRIGALKHRSRLIELLDVQVLEFISNREIEDLILDSPPEHFSQNQCYAWQLLLHDISIALIDRVVRFAETPNSKLDKTPLEAFPWLSVAQLKQWYRQDSTYFMMVLLKACPPGQNRISPGVIRTSMQLLR